MTPSYSVVIPSRDGGERVLEVLRALEAQRDAPAFEVVVADDGSTDGTAERVEAIDWRLPVLVSRAAHQGPAAARNRGVGSARGGRIAFLGDDTIPDPDWLATHDAAWRLRGGGERIAVVGYTGWHERVRQTPFLRFLNEEGLQFGYGLIDDPENVPFNFFYTSNLSLSRRLLLAEPFDVSFPYAAWEDIEASYRLRKHELRLVYEAGARTWHDHPTDFERFCRRQEQAGYCAVVFWQRHPEMGSFLGLGPEGPAPLPGRWAQAAREGLVRALQFAPVSLRGLWSEALRYHYLRGLHRGWRERVATGGTPS